MNKFWIKKTPPQVNLSNAEVAAVEFKRRHWKYAQLEGPTLPLRNDPEPFHKVTHRAIGDIPGCTMAPKEHIFRDTSAAQAAGQTMMRASLYAREMQKYVDGEYGGDHGLEDMWSAISRIPPLLGPHGEKL